MSEVIQLTDAVTGLRADPATTLIALDFDGTLAPIVPDPSRSRPLPGTVDALTAIATRGTQLAVITGRDARTVLELGSLAAVPDLMVSGLYGAETWYRGDLDTPRTPGEIEQLRARLPEVLAAHGADERVWIEDKRLSLVVHGRQADDPGRALAALRGPVEALARELGMEIHPGRAVLEVRLPGYDKAGALRRLVSRFAPRSVLFAGDDVGDLPAFEVIADLRDDGLAAWAVGVASAEVAELAGATDVVVDGPEGILALLRALASGTDPDVGARG